MKKAERDFVEATAGVCKEVTVETLTKFGDMYYDLQHGYGAKLEKVTDEYLSKLIQKGFDVAEKRLNEGT